MKETFEWDQYIQEALEGANDPEGIDHLCRLYAVQNGSREG